MRHLLKHLLWIVLLVSAACKKEAEPAQPQQEKPFQYMKTGNRWVYDLKVNGTKMDSLTREIVADSQGVYRSVIKDKYMTLTEYFVVKNDSLMYNEQGKTAVLLMRSSAPKGYQWYKVVQNDSALVKILDTGVPVEADKTYRCTLLEETNLKTKGKVLYDIDPQAGLVGIHFTSGSQQVDYVLRRKNF